MSDLQLSLLTREQLLDLIKLVHLKIEADASKLKDFKVFAKEIYHFILDSSANKNLAITLVWFLPDVFFKLVAAGEYPFRKVLRSQNISHDSIMDIEDTHFNSLENVVAYLT